MNHSMSDTRESRDRRRKATHSAIERRRRERTNDKIAQLKDMLPSCAGRSGLHKLTILEEGIQYTRMLEGQIRELQLMAARVPLLQSRSAMEAASPAVTSKVMCMPSGPASMPTCANIKLEDTAESHESYRSNDRRACHSLGTLTTPVDQYHLDTNHSLGTFATLCSASKMLPSPACSQRQASPFSEIAGICDSSSSTHSPCAEIMSLGSILS
ncbi:hypothetical protein BATDEDRAFT_91690 [Batrachochytrium dendrobatidis JAM81]|uniref:BHLH domain-containing protein n=1 Tax=Batrachochytrium dendrobatidis (strain JAM81 / FGSC 10211) TaxID=684364 RepID=F4PBM4_BATDJ|nr:uncharacterized protein BATDEDRAFT_91690 [Batrachochytrium dendrobatidis JAM81]EGF77350.1 hypothetical protein BATDEDRAFT_91690 [Batrachochytrium dendrobatidis JAM81]|eukprot:XP_006682048.1 hypothetical protein BATDEDRAFT_91690 [Batrachochytrium dendrobatidis JAM81]